MYRTVCDEIPVFLHNLKNCDTHPIIQKAHELSEKKRIDVIAQNNEKFITLAFKNLSFNDSFSLVSESLDELAKLTKYEGAAKREDWDKHSKFSKRNRYVKNREDLDLLAEKASVLMTTLTTTVSFYENELPPKEAFYSKLTEEHI